MTVSALTAALLAGTAEVSARPDAGARTNLYRVEIGVPMPYPMLTVHTFLPARITIHAGDSVEWTNTTGSEPQTVTFGPIENTPPLIVANGGPMEIDPLVAQPRGGRTIGDVSLDVYSSGVLMSGLRGHSTRYTFTFKTPGTYLYRSLFHPGALGEVDVVPASQPVAPPPLDRAPGAFAALRAISNALYLNTPAERAGGANGVTGATVLIGFGNSSVSVNKFTPAGVTIAAGDSVTWVTRETSGDPHEIVFRPTDSESQGHGVLYGGFAADGGLKLDAAYVAPTLPSGTTVTTDTQTTLQSAGGRWQSGLLYGSSINAQSRTPSSYTLTFAAPGQYYYADPFYTGMFGEVNVIPAPAG